MADGIGFAAYHTCTSVGTPVLGDRWRTESSNDTGVSPWRSARWVGRSSLGYDRLGVMDQSTSPQGAGSGSLDEEQIGIDLDRHTSKCQTVAA